MTLTEHIYEPSVEEANAFEEVFRDAREREDHMPAPDIAWYPQAGAQEAFLSCPLREVLLHGPRGSGKTDPLIMDFAADVGRGHGDVWRGILFRKTYPQLGDVVAKSLRWFKLIFPTAQFNWSRMAWVFPTQEVLMFRHMAKPEDYWNYHGHEYPWIAFEELTAWADSECYTAMFSCNRASKPNVPRRIRSTTNPYGVGLNWIKDRWKLAGQWWKTIVIPDVLDDDGEVVEHARAAIHGKIDENKILLKSDPSYKASVKSSARNSAMEEAWLDGSWDIVAGGMFDEVWKPQHNIVTPFEIPDEWRVDRSFDWGSSSPFSVGWWAESNGSDYVDAKGRNRSSVPGDLYRIGEWYGWTGQPNQGLRMLAVDIARGIVERERARWPDRVILEGPADTSIYDVENGMSIAVDMEKPVEVAGVMYPGVRWVPADKRSRVTGWEMMRKMLRNAHPNEDGTPREHPGLFVFETCDQTIRTIPSAPRSEKDPDDLDTNSEDHIADDMRYRVRFASRYRPSVGGVGPIGLKPKLITGKG